MTDNPKPDQDDSLLIIPDHFPEFDLEPAEPIEKDLSQQDQASPNQEVSPIEETSEVAAVFKEALPEEPTPRPQELLDSFGQQGNLGIPWTPPELDSSHPASQIPSPEIQVEDDFEAWRRRTASNPHTALNHTPNVKARKSSGIGCLFILVVLMALMAATGSCNITIS